MSKIKIQTIKNGPLKVSGGVELVDGEGKKIKTEGKDIWFCRCGQSKNKPFCDGTHVKVGFKAE